MAEDQNKDRLCRFMSQSILVFGRRRVNLYDRGRVASCARAQLAMNKFAQGKFTLPTPEERQ